MVIQCDEKHERKEREGRKGKSKTTGEKKKKKPKLMKNVIEIGISRRSHELENGF